MPLGLAGPVLEAMLGTTKQVNQRYVEHTTERYELRGVRDTLRGQHGPQGRP